MASRYSPNKDDRALSLLEVIITISILSLGIVSVLQAFSFCARATGLSCDIIKAVFFIEDKMQELEFKEKQKLISQEEAEVKGQKEKFEYIYTTNLNSNLNLFESKFLITWTRTNRQEDLSINTYLRP